jgi:hypothetical protein
MLKLSISEANKTFTREQLRAIMPEVTAFFDKMNAEFPGSKVVYAREGGLEIGEPSPPGVVPYIDPTPIETPLQKAIRMKEQMRSRRKRR